MTDVSNVRRLGRIEHELGNLMRNYRLREPQEDICRHALREEFKKLYPRLASHCVLKHDHYWIPGNGAKRVDIVKLHFRSAVDRLAALV